MAQTPNVGSLVEDSKPDEAAIAGRQNPGEGADMVEGTGFDHRRLGNRPAL